MTPNVPSYQCTTASPSIFVEVLISIVLAPVKEDSFLLYSSAQSILPYDKLPNMTSTLNDYCKEAFFFFISFSRAYSVCPILRSHSLTILASN